MENFVPHLLLLDMYICGRFLLMICNCKSCHCIVSYTVYFNDLIKKKVKFASIY